MLRALAGIFLALGLLVGTGGAAFAEKRVALVIGNGAYKAVSALPNPKNDAAAVASALTRAGFEVTAKYDLTVDGMRRVLADFEDRATGADWAFVYYAGHGMELNGKNWLIPIDAQLARATDAPDEAVALERVLDRLTAAKKLRIVVLDACRNNPFLARMAMSRGATRAVTRGLTAVDPAHGEVVFYAARDGNIALDGSGGNSPFAAALVKHMDEEGVELSRFFRKVTSTVREATGNQQEPFVYGSIPDEDYYFKPPPSAPPPTGPQAPLSSDAQAWSVVQNTGSEGVLEEFVRGFPDSVYAGFAKARLEELKKSRAASGDGSNSSWWPFGGTQAPQKPKETQVAAVAPPNAAPAQRDDAACSDGLLVSVAMGPKPCIKPGSGESFKDCPECPEMVIVPSGSFRMGSLESEPEREAAESPQHRVAIGTPFAVGKFAVTFAEWDACVDAGGCAYIPDDKGWGRADRPVINVSWDDAKVYLAWLSKKTGKRYRLLSEAEREYAARAGTAAPFWWGASITPEQANYDGTYTYAGGGSKGEYRQKTLPVSAFKPNPWGLYQVHGNVWEWTEDCWNDNYTGAPGDGSARTTGSCGHRVIRGGSWNVVPWNLRAAYRDWNYSGPARLSGLPAGEDLLKLASFTPPGFEKCEGFHNTGLTRPPKAEFFRG